MAGRVYVSISGGGATAAVDGPVPETSFVVDFIGGEPVVVVHSPTPGGGMQPKQTPAAPSTEEE